MEKILGFTLEKFLNVKLKAQLNDNDIKDYVYVVDHLGSTSKLLFIPFEEDRMEMLEGFQIYGHPVSKAVPKMLLTCPHCAVSINEGSFTEDVMYTVNIDPSNGGSDYTRGSIETVLDDAAQPAGEYRFYCRECDTVFEHFRKRPLQLSPVNLKKKEEK